LDSSSWYFVVKVSVQVGRAGTVHVGTAPMVPKVLRALPGDI